MTVSAFIGPVAEFSARFRRGYPDAVVDRLATRNGCWTAPGRGPCARTWRHGSGGR